jgi:alpha-galactosidase
VWIKPLADGSVAVALTNAGAAAGDVGSTAAAIGLPDSDCYRVRNLWAHSESESTGSVGPVQIPAHGVAMFRVSFCG